MKKKVPKGTFFCERCKAGCLIYKKGKGHRVLVCPNCGVLATNGLLSLAGGAIGSVLAPGAGTVVGSTLGTVAEGLFQGKSSPEGARYRVPSQAKFDYVKYALGGK